MNIRTAVTLSLMTTAFTVPLMGCSFSSPKQNAGGTGGAGVFPDGGGTAGTGGGSTSGTGGGSGPLGGSGSGTGGAAAGSGTAGSGSGTGSAGTTGSGGGAGTTVVVGSTQCSDGLDNDHDGKIDLLDPECVSPLDNDESSFATGIPGDNMDACKQDCFFDGNSGMGDDGCDWDLSCDPANTGVGAAGNCPYNPAAHNCTTTQSAKCIKNCGAVTPNGCDCFGCCTVPGVSHPVRLDPTCTAANFNDPTKCPVCTQQTSCMNTCGKCQFCLGKTVLDPSCYPPAADGGTSSDGGSSTGDAGTATDGATPPPPPPICPTGQIVCGTNPALCPNGTLCVTGCCVNWIF